ncbi:MAG: hypothetical protein Q9217_004846 [Psora testacea]
MSLKQEIEIWVMALGQYDNHEFEEALKTFDGISDTSKILFNCGMIHATLGQHAKAVECFQRAIKRDNYLAVAYFQQGVSNFLMGDFEEALANFNDTLLYLRGNKFINYEQLGLKYKLYSCEVLFNRGLCYIYLTKKETGMADLNYAAQEKQTPEHDVIDEAIHEGAEVSLDGHEDKIAEMLINIQDFTVFSIGVGIVYRPNSAKVKNLKAKDYLGKARLIATADHNHITGSDAKKAALQAAAGRSSDDRAPESISFAASHLVKPNLHSRSRQRSEPPVHRNVFPPTPPPEKENDKLRGPSAVVSSFPSSKPPSLASLRLETPQPPPNHPLRPEPLKLSQSSFTSLEQKELPRVGTARTASEPRGPAHRDPCRREREHRQPHRLFMETTPLRPHSGSEADTHGHPEEADFHNHPAYGGTQSSQSSTSDKSWRSHRRSNRSRSRGPRMTQYSIEEEDETGGATSTGSSVDEYEIMHNAGGGLSRPPPALPPATNSFPRARAQSERPQYRRARSDPHHFGTSVRRPPELKNIRIKCHYGDDTRFIMLSPEVAFETFLEKVKEKSKLPKNQSFKVKVRDEEGDLITMGDEDDWDMALATVRKEVADAVVSHEGSGSPGEGQMGKMEVWVV